MANQTKNPHAVALGKLGGQKGGKAKVPKGFAMLTPEQRKAMAQKAVAARKPLLNPAN